MTIIHCPVPKTPPSNALVEVINRVVTGDMEVVHKNGITVRSAQGGVSLQLKKGKEVRYMPASDVIFAARRLQTGRLNIS